MSGTVAPAWTGDPYVLAVLRPRRRRSALTTLTMVGLAVALVLVGLALLLVGEPASLLISALAAAVSFPLLIWFFFWLDRWEPEPPRYRWAALIWGGSAAVLIAAGAQIVLHGFVPSEAALAVVVAPLTEELAKGLFVLLVVWLRRPQLHGVVDGIVYAGLSAIGFAFTEDVLYYSAALTDGGPTELASLVVIRGVFTPFAHPLFSCAFGVGLGIAVTARSREAKVLAPLLGYLVAVLLHAIWNGSTMVAQGAGFLVAYLVVMLPALVGLVALATSARRKEGVMIQRALTDCAARGWVSTADITVAGNMAARRAARRTARLRGGKPAAQLMETYQNDLAALAFLHDAVLTSPPPPDPKVAARVGELLWRTQVLRPYALPLGASGPPGGAVGPPQGGAPGLR